MWLELHVYEKNVKFAINTDKITTVEDKDGHALLCINNMDVVIPVEETYGKIMGMLIHGEKVVFRLKGEKDD